MLTAARQTLHKRPVNLLLNEENVQQARNFTNNLSATVDSLLADYVAKQNEAVLSKQKRGDAVAEAWNRFYATHGSFADDYSTL
ncbi:MAG: type II toxin-antitoxin system CcdA family antitoxin [Sulfuricellaceae bacterium]